MSVDDKILKARVQDALNNEDLQKGLKKATDNYRKKREKLFADIDFDSLQAEVTDIRQKSIDNIKQNLEKFKINAEQNGIKVLETVDKRDTLKKILEIINLHKGKKVVKAKSMVCEEIDLNDYLEKRNVQVIETDLGEWLVQLAGEKPSHITAPAIHMTKERVADLLNKRFSASLQPVPADITRFARHKLRQEFLDADIGITGANLLISETGSVVIVSNEGNARLVSSLPDVHIVLTTYEKLVEKFSEAERILQVLTKCATGQNITSYISVISGPSKTSDIEKTEVIGVHGPEHVYVVIMDNHRNDILKDQDFREVLKCIKCGGCLGMCPVYQSVGGHVFGKKYFGGVGAILTAFLEDIDSAKDLTTLCSGCTICKQICPAGVDIPSMVLKLKEDLYSNNKLSLSKQILFKGLFSNKSLFETSLTIASKVQNIFSRHKDEIDHLPGHFSKLTSFRSLPKFSKYTFEQIAAKEKLFHHFDTEKKSLVLFSGCLIERLYPEIGVDAVKLLHKLDYDVFYPSGQTCCGLPAKSQGDKEGYENFIDENRKVFSKLRNQKLEGMITLCPSCTSAIKDSHLIPGIEVLDFTQLLYNIYTENKMPVREMSQITYHPSCHYSKYAYQQTYTHKLLLEIYKDEFIEYEDMYNCCGAAGSYTLEFPDISEKILSRKLDNIIKSGAKTLITDCPACLMQFKGAISKQHLPLKIAYITEVFYTK